MNIIGSKRGAILLDTGMEHKRALEVFKMVEKHCKNVRECGLFILVLRTFWPTGTKYTNVRTYCIYLLHCGILQNIKSN